MTRSIRAFLILSILLFAGAGSVSITQPDATALKYGTIINADKIKTHLMVLASDSLEGRETASPGILKAANYVASEFKSYGLPPLANGTFFQEFPLLNTIAGLMTINTLNKSYKYSEDFYSVNTTGDLLLKENEIVFAGYGIVDSVSGWNDYDQLNVENQVVMILEGEPINKKGLSLISKDGKPSAWADERRKKISIAESKKARAILFVNNDFKDSYENVSKWLQSGRLSLDDEQVEKKVPSVYISTSMADDFLKLNGLTVSEYKKKVAAGKKPSHILVKQDISIINKPQKLVCRNVLGYVEGSDLKEEVIIITAHLDHLGKRGDKIYYGADDDGSGCASLLTIAEAFAQAKKEGNGPRRSILIMTFSGEEKGLLGSRYYTMHPVFPLSNTVVNLNIDMIGRTDTIHKNETDYVYVIGSDKLSTELHLLNENTNATYSKLELDYRYNDPSDKQKLYYRSDHYNFAKNNIPVIFYFTGLHEDYHKPTDTIDKIDFEKTALIARHVYHTAWELANRSERIQVNVENDFK